MAKKKVPDFQRKKSHKGKACRSKKPIYYSELKQHCNIMLTPTSIKQLEEIALQKKISRSEVIERIMRSTISQAENLSALYKMLEEQNLDVGLVAVVEANEEEGG